MALRIPNLQAQRHAMEKLAFLTGKWTGGARLLRGPTEFVELLQTEEAQYKLDGLILVIEGVGRTAMGGQPLLQAFGTISYDDESETYHLRAFNDGRFLETEVKLLEHGKGMTWGVSLGEIKTKSILRINERGEWTEFAEIFIGSQSPRKLLELTVHSNSCLPSPDNAVTGNLGYWDWTCPVTRLIRSWKRSRHLQALFDQFCLSNLERQAAPMKHWSKRLCVLLVFPSFLAFSAPVEAHPPSRTLLLDAIATTSDIHRTETLV